MNFAQQDVGTASAVPGNAAMRAKPVKMEHGAKP
jgi:hypothetical protein